MNQSQLIERIHAAARPMVLAITGGGSGAIAELLKVPGGSATVLEATVPYSAAALEQWLGGVPDHYCNERTARAMAMAAFERARRLSTADPHALLGIGATASLASNRLKRGPHRIHVAWQSAERTVVISCELTKGARTRVEEEQLATQLILHTVAESCGLTEAAFHATLPASPLSPSPSGRGQGEGALATSIDLPTALSLLPTEHITRRDETAPPAWSELLLGQRNCAFVPENAIDENKPPHVLFPGAFNPLHAGHQRMAEVAAERLGEKVTFELSILNVDKPPLDVIEIADRLRQFNGGQVLLTRASRFVEKAQLAPGCTFIVGADTILRIGEPKYYEGGDAARDAAVATISAAGCRFLVFGRTLQGCFQTLSNLAIPPLLRRLCDEVPESQFRDNISSTELRNR